MLAEIERLIKSGRITDTVIAQIGNTKFTTDLPNSKMQLIDFTTPKEMDTLIENADFIITHGGVATIIKGVNIGKKIIAVPRLKKYREHVNDHQLQIIENFSESGYIVGTKGVEDIEDSLDKIKEFIPKKYKSNNQAFVEKLMNTINS